MKIRQGFVSNSSSSSFIVAVDAKEDEVLIKIELHVNLMSYVDKRLTTIKELDKYKGELGYGGPWADYEKCKKAIESGKAILIGEISDHGNGGSDMDTALRERGLRADDFANGEIIMESR